MMNDEGLTHEEVQAVIRMTTPDPSRQTGSRAWHLITPHEPQCEEIVWLWDGVRMWIGGRDMVDGEHWLWGKCYSVPWFNGLKWEGEVETDDDYQPTHYMPLPWPMNKQT